MSREHYWNRERISLMPTHRKIEAEIERRCKDLRRTWIRMSFHDREKILDSVLRTLPDGGRMWASKFGIADVFKAIVVKDGDRLRAESL